MRRLIDPTAQAERHVSQRLGVTPQSDITNAINDTARDAGDGGHALYDPTGRLMDPNATEVAFAGSTVAVSRNGKRSTVTVTAVKPTGDTMTGPLVVNAANASVFRINSADGATEYLNVDSTAIPFLQTYNGLDLQMFSDAGTTRVFTIDGATGTIFFGTSTAVIIRTGSGTPEASIAAPIGSLWLRTNGTGAATLYVKTSGTGNTGWDAVTTLAGAQTLTGKTLTTPTIADFTNATHLHADAASGGLLTGYVPTFLGTPTIAAQTGLGTTGAVSIAGNDRTGLVTITPGGTGIASGTQARITFSAARAASTFSVQLIRADLGAGTVDVRPTGRTTARFDVWVAAALTSGTAYSFFYTVEGY